MQILSEVLHEILRLQVLVFASRSRERMTDPVTLDELATWLRVPVDEAAELIRELHEEGLVEALLPGPFPAQSVLRLTVIGEGWLAWMHQQTKKPPC